VGSGTAVASNPVPAPDAASNAMDLASAAETGMIPDVAVTDTPDLPSQKGPGDVSATRTITAVSNTELLVEVTVQKGLLRGFGKLQENLPEGFTAVVKEEDDAIFSTKDRIAKFVWLNLPSKSEIKVSYRLLAPTGASGTFTVNGEFGYLLNDLTQRAVVGSTSFTLDSEAMAAEIPPTQQPEATPPANQQTGTSQEAAKPAVTSPTTNAQSQEGAPKQNGTTAQATTPKASSTPAPESGITFKVQITAAHREVGQAYFIQRHRYDGPFSIEHNDGWIKYVTGMFDRYRSARDQRQAYLDANYNFPGPFVTAYNNGERITVQEALMIAKQSSVQ